MSIEHVSLAHIKDKRFLLVLSKGSEYWQAPGGVPEEGETDKDTLVRECAEELAVKIRSESIKHLATIHGGAHSKTGVDIEIRIYTAEFDGEITPSGEIEKAEYFAFSDLPRLPQIGIEFLTKLHREGLI